MSYEPNPATRALLGEGTPVPFTLGPAILDRMLAEEDPAAWPGRPTASRLREFLQQRDLQRAARPPDVHVVIEGVPGEFHTRPGSGLVAWTPPERT